MKVTREKCEDERLESLCKFKEMIKRVGREVELFLQRRVKRKNSKNAINYRTKAVETSRILIMMAVQVEKALKPILQAISYLARGKKNCNSGGTVIRNSRCYSQAAFSNAAED